MCRLLGLSVDNSVRRSTALHYLRTFFHEFGSSNPHGWGFVSYVDGKPVLVKEPVRANDSALLKFLLNSKVKVSSSALIAHVRYRTVGPCNHELTQPFTTRSISFAHNGTIHSSLGTFDSNVSSDSLHLFHSLTTKLIPSWDFVYGELVKMNNIKGNMLNVLMSNGKDLFVYKDQRNARSLFYRHIEGGVVVCSTPMSKSKGWKVVTPGLGIVFEQGNLVKTIGE